MNSSKAVKHFKAVYNWIGGGIRAIQFQSGKVLWVNNESDFADICCQYSGYERFWVSINPLKTTKKRTKSNVKALMNIVIDIDSSGGKNEETVQVVKRVLNYIEEETGVRTSIPIIFSGYKGFHIWLQLKPIEINNNWEKYDNLLRIFIDNLARRFNTSITKIDEKVKGIERVIGIPFTIHTGSTKLIKPVNLSIFQSGRYDFEVFNEWLLSQKSSKNHVLRSPKEFSHPSSDILNILSGVASGERNNSSFKLASYFKDFEVPQEITIWVLSLWNQYQNVDPLSNRELKTTIRSAYKKPIIPKKSVVGVFKLE